MRYWACLLFCILAFFNVTSHAADSSRYLAIQSFSLHFEKIKQRNGFNPTIGYEVTSTKRLGWQAGLFKDSFNYNSAYAGLNYAFDRFYVLGRPVRPLLSVNVIHKKFKKNGNGETKLVPIPVIEVNVFKKLNVNISGTPQIDSTKNHTNGVIFFQFKYLLN